MKVSFSRGFDTEAVIKVFKDAKILGTDEFVNNVAEVLDKLSLFVQKNISLADNIDQSTVSYKLFHNQSLMIEVPNNKKKAKAIIPFQTDVFENPLTSFSWRYTLQGKIEIRAWFLNAPTKGQNVSMSVFY